MLQPSRWGGSAVRARARSPSRSFSVSPCRGRIRDPPARGQDWIERQKDQIDGLNVIAVFVFAIVAMESVPRNVMAHPLFAAVLLALIILLSCAS